MMVVMVVMVVMVCLRLHHSRHHPSLKSASCRPCMSDRSNAARAPKNARGRKPLCCDWLVGKANVLLQSGQFADVQLSVSCALHGRLSLAVGTDLTTALITGLVTFQKAPDKDGGGCLPVRDGFHDC